MIRTFRKWRNRVRLAELANDPIKLSTDQKVVFLESLASIASEPDADALETLATILSNEGFIRADTCRSTVDFGTIETFRTTQDLNAILAPTGNYPASLGIAAVIQRCRGEERAEIVTKETLAAVERMLPVQWPFWLAMVLLEDKRIIDFLLRQLLQADAASIGHASHCLQLLGHVPVPTDSLVRFLLGLQDLERAVSLGLAAIAPIAEVLKLHIQTSENETQHRSFGGGDYQNSTKENRAYCMSMQRLWIDAIKVLATIASPDAIPALGNVLTATVRVTNEPARGWYPVEVCSAAVSALASFREYAHQTAGPLAKGLQRCLDEIREFDGAAFRRMERSASGGQYDTDSSVSPFPEFHECLWSAYSKAWQDKAPKEYNPVRIAAAIIPALVHCRDGQQDPCLLEALRRSPALVRPILDACNSPDGRPHIEAPASQPPIIAVAAAAPTTHSLLCWGDRDIYGTGSPESELPPPESQIAVYLPVERRIHTGKTAVDLIPDLAQALATAAESDHYTVVLLVSLTPLCPQECVNILGNIQEIALRRGDEYYSCADLLNAVLFALSSETVQNGAVLAPLILRHWQLVETAARKNAHRIPPLLLRTLIARIEVYVRRWRAELPSGIVDAFRKLSDIERDEWTRAARDWGGMHDGEYGRPTTRMYSLEQVRTAAWEVP